MTAPRVLLRVARADFLERVRRHAFLVTLAFTIYAAFLFVPPNHSVYATLRFGEYRGVYNSAWVGSLVAMLSATFLTLAGFYLVKNAVERDRRSGVGAVLAGTPLPSALYLTAKAISNLAVLGAMIVALIVASGVMQMMRAESTRLDPVALITPFLVITLPAMALVAALAVLFEVVPFLRGGFGNVIYFFFWIFSLSLTATLGRQGLQDPTGIGTVLGQMRDALVAIHPDVDPERSSMGFNFKAKGVWDLRTFVWDGLRLTPGLVVARAAWLGVAFALPVFAAVFFDRFDAGVKARPPRRSRTRPAAVAVAAPATQAAASLAPIETLAGPGAANRLGALAVAELRLALQGVTRWWWIVTAGLIVAAIFVPGTGLRFVLPFALIWPLLLWSPLGTREAQHGTEGMLFSTPRPLGRLLTAQWLAGAAVAALSASGALLRYAIHGEWALLAGMLLGVAFIPSLALACGTWTGNSRLFEIFYLLLWYAGPLERVPVVDFSGGTGITPVTPIAIASLLALAWAGRWRRLRT